MNKIPFEQEITNDVLYEDGKNKEQSDYSKEYTKKKWIFGIRVYSHVFRETIHSKESNTKTPVGFNGNKG